MNCALSGFIYYSQDYAYSVSDTGRWLKMEDEETKDS